MVDRNLIREFQVDDEELDAALGGELAALLADEDSHMDAVYSDSSSNFDVNELVKGRVLSVEGDEVLVDIGYKSEGIVPLYEWADEEVKPAPGDIVEVLHFVGASDRFIAREFERHFLRLGVRAGLTGAGFAMLVFMSAT